MSDANQPNDPSPPAGDQQEVAVLTQPSANGTHEANGHAEAPVKRRPAASFAAMSDRTTRIEVAVWANQVKTADAEYTQYALTITRSWRDPQGTWHTGGSYRVHDIPVLLYLIQHQAYAWALAQRTEAKFDGEPLPF